MATKRDCLAHSIVEHQVEAMAIIDSLAYKARGLPAVLLDLEMVRKEIKEANMAACRCWFSHEWHDGGDSEAA